MSSTNSLLSPVSPSPEMPAASSLPSERETKRRPLAATSVVNARTLVGIEVGMVGARIASLKQFHPDVEKYRWVGHFDFSFPAESGPFNRQRATECIRTLAERLPRCMDGDRNEAVIGLPLHWMQLQTTFGTEVDSFVDSSEQHFAESGFEGNSHISYWPVVGEHHGTPKQEDQYVVATLPETLIIELVDAVARQGYSVRSALPTPVALNHAAFPLTGIDAQCLVSLDQHSASISVQHRSGIGLTRKLPSLVSQSKDDVPVTDSSALSPYLRQLSKAIRETLVFSSRSDMSSLSNKPVLITGELAETEGIESKLATQLEMPVAVWSLLGTAGPAATDSGESDELTPLRDSCRFASAISLARTATCTGDWGYEG